MSSSTSRDRLVTSEDSDLDNPSTSTPKKKLKLSYNQKYRKDWEAEFNWITSSKKGPFFAW